VEPAVRPDVCSQPTAGAAVGLVCVVIFGWVMVMDILEGAGLQENMGVGHRMLAKFAQVY